MPVLIKSHIDRCANTAVLRFPYDAKTVEALKEYPGPKWNKAAKVWECGLDLIPVLKQRFVLSELMLLERRAEIPPLVAQSLRPYQLEAAEFLIRNRAGFLFMQQRTGKTACAIAAACALIGSGQADAIVVIYPAGVQGEWIKQPKQFANMDLVPLEGTKPFIAEEIAYYRQQPYLMLGCHPEILKERVADIHQIMAGRRYVLIADEIQLYKNRKIARTQAVWTLAWANGQPLEVENKTDLSQIEHIQGCPSGTCVAAWGTTGTPVRNRPKDAWALFHFAKRYSGGGYWDFAKRYCDAHQDERGHWDDKGSSNEEELGQRLNAMAYRKTRAEVAPWLPKSDRKVIKVDLTGKQLQQYKKLERHYAPLINRALSGVDNKAAEDALIILSKVTSGAKTKMVVERAYQHADEGVKVIVGAWHHETLQMIEAAFDKIAEEAARQGDPVPPHFTAGGWHTPTKRRETIERWRSCPGPSILLANSLSSGVGIDLADAEVQINVELLWVPADMQQWEDRIQDVHLGKRKTPPIYEYLLCRDTIDEAMAAALITKDKVINKIFDTAVEAGSLTATLREGDIVNSGALGLVNNDEETVKAAMLSIRDRWAEITGDGNESDAAVLAGDFQAEWEDEEQPTADDDEEAAA